MPVSSPSPYALSLPRNDTRPPWIRCWHRNSLQYRQCSHPPRFSYDLHIPRHRKQDCHPFPSLGSFSPRYADEHPPDICEVLSGGRRSRPKNDRIPEIPGLPAPFSAGSLPAPADCIPVYCQSRKKHFQKYYLMPFLRCRNGSHHAGSTATDHNHLTHFYPLLPICPSIIFPCAAGNSPASVHHL